MKEAAMRTPYRQIAIFIACLAFAAPSAAETVGSMTAYQTNIVRNNGGTMNVGAGVELGDQLRSNPTGLGMLVFRDESSAKIGPNTSLTIDEFVYNPGSGSGKIDIGMNSGLARFYGGQVSKGGVMQVATPHMVLGARGGIIEVLVAAGQTVGILRAGRMTCTINGKRLVITNPGYACTSEDGKLLTGYGGIDTFPVLDSIDRIAGTGLPGAPGPGLDVSAICASALGGSLKVCESTDGALPGVVMEFPDSLTPPVGGGVDKGECEGEGCCYYCN
ncbi:FecR domain-containing protein [Mesorhizobium sp. M0643]|uniref:FecR family protein n=2 Tax=Mesorhizobium TaxID=68287 RepID=UPI003336E959